MSDAPSCGISVGELASLPHLRMRVLAGRDGLDQRIVSAHVVDARRPWDWLDPGALVLTTGWIVPADEPSQTEFVERSHGAGLCGLVLGDYSRPDSVCPTLSEAMLATAERLGFPVLQVDYAVPWAPVIHAVSASTESEEKSSLNHIMRVHNEVRLSLTEGRSSAEFVAGLGRALGCELHLVEPTSWEPVLPCCPAPDRSWRAALDRALEQRRGKAPTVMHLEVAGQVALVTPVPVERPTFLFVAPIGHPGPRVAVLQHVAAACALEMTRIDAGFERERRSGAALLAEGLQGTIDGRVLDASLDERGLAAPRVCVAIQSEHETVDRLARRWAIHGVPHVLGGFGPTCIGILRADEALIADLGELARVERFRVGVSDPFSRSGGLIDASRQARWASETIHQGNVGLARYGNDGDVLLPRTLSEARMAANRILEPVLAYDREHGTELIRTLETYLQCDRSPKQAARILFVHNQTVNYRIGRIEDLTGRSMRSTGDISELWFGLRALALSQTSADGSLADGQQMVS